MLAIMILIESSNSVKNTLNVQTLNLQIANSNLLTNNVCAEYEHKLNTELIKQSKPNKITTTMEIKWKILREKRCKHKNNTVMCYKKPKSSA